jgi:hypothetical protein
MRAPAPTASGSGLAKPKARALKVESSRMPVPTPPDRELNRPHASIRMDARLDADTRQKVDDLAGHFRRTRAAALCHIMQWGLDHGAVAIHDRDHVHGPVCHLYCYVDAGLYKAVQQAAAAAGVHMASWLRQMVRHIPLADFPASWQAARSEARSHDSRRYATRAMLRLDAASRRTLQGFVEHFGVPKAAIIRQLILQATPEDFPPSWQMRATERHTAQARPARRR